MVKLLLLPYTATVLLAAQVAPFDPAMAPPNASNPSLPERLDSLRRRFPPDLLSVARDRGHVKPLAYCVTPELETNSLSIQRCQPSTPHLLPSLQRLRPGNKSAK